MSRLSLKSKAGPGPEPVTDAHLEAAFHEASMSEAPISIIMAGNPPTDPKEENPAEKADVQVSAEKAKSPHAKASPPAGRAVRSTRRRSAPIVDQFSDPEEEALAHERPGEEFVIGARLGNDRLP